MDYVHLKAQALSHTRKYPTLIMFGLAYYHTQPHGKMSSDLYIKLPKLTYTYNVLTFPAKTIVAVKHQQFTFHTN